MESSSGGTLPRDNSVVRGGLGRRDPGPRHQGQRVRGSLPLSPVVSWNLGILGRARAADHCSQALRTHEVHSGQGPEGLLRQNQGALRGLRQGQGDAGLSGGHRV